MHLDAVKCHNLMIMHNKYYFWGPEYTIMLYIGDEPTFCKVPPLLCVNIAAVLKTHGLHTPKLVGEHNAQGSTAKVSSVVTRVTAAVLPTWQD